MKTVTPPGRADPPRLVRLLAFERCELLDVVGPLEAFATAAQIAGGIYRVEIVAPAGGPVRAASGLAVLATAIADATAAADTLLVAGGSGVLDAAADRTVVAWLRRAARRARRTGSVCAGAMLLARTGLLDGRRVATHWAWCDRLAAAHPALRVQRDPIFVRDGAFWSSAGVTAGIDLALAMIEDDHGPALALAVARELVVYLKRPGGQAQFSVELAAQATGDGPIGRAQQWAAAHPEADLGVERLAARAAMSVRNFARVFRAETGRTPGAFVAEMRLARACRLLEGTRLSVEEVARRAGFRSGDVLRRVFQRRKSVTPGDYRARFAARRRRGPAP